MRRLATLTTGLVLALGALTACSEEEAQDAVDRARDEVSSAVGDVEMPEVDWDKYGTKVKDELDRLAEKADCSALEEELAQAEENDTDLTAYIKAKIREVC